MRPGASVKQVAMEIVLSLLLLGAAGASAFATPAAPTSESAVSQWDHYFGVAISGDRAYVVGSAGVVLTSDDRGRTWNRQILRRPSDRSEGTAADLCGIAMAPLTLPATASQAALERSSSGRMTTWLRTPTRPFSRRYPQNFRLDLPLVAIALTTVWS